MRALVVVESMWGNTRAVAEAVARGLGGDPTVIDVDQAPSTLPTNVGLLVVGGPTHALSMSRRSSDSKVSCSAGPSKRCRRSHASWVPVHARPPE